MSLAAIILEVAREEHEPIQAVELAACMVAPILAASGADVNQAIAQKVKASIIQKLKGSAAAND
jgi:hypothetical protein